MAHRPAARPPGRVRPARRHGHAAAPGDVAGAGRPGLAHRRTPRRRRGPDDEDDEDDPVETGAHGADVPRRRGLRGRRPAETVPDDDGEPVEVPYDSAAVVWHEDDPVPAPGSTRGPSSARRRPRRAAAVRPRHGPRRRAPAEPVEPVVTPMPDLSDLPAARRAAHPDRRHRLLAARRPAAARRHAAQDAQPGQRLGRRGAHRRAPAVPDRRRRHRLHPRPHGHPVRGRARPGRQGRAGHRAEPQHQLRRGQRRGPDPLADPRQVRHRHRDPQRRQGDRLPRRRAPLRGRAAQHPPHDHRRRQGRRGRLRRRQPRQDAPPARGRGDRRGQVARSSTR